MNKHLVISNSQNRLWLTAIGVLAILQGVILYLYRDTLIAMIDIWERSETFTHCFLVLPISLWLIWRKRAEILTLQPSPNFWVLLPLLLGGVFWLFGDITATNSISQFSLVFLIVASVVLVLGSSVARTIIFPLSFLFFAVPIGEFLLPVLMEWTANFTIFALRLSGIPVYRDGLQFVIPSGNWSVVEACSGVRYLIASLTVGTLFAYLNYSSYKRRFVFILISIVVPIFANWLRAYMIVLLGHLSGNTIAVGVDHIIYGWVFFGIVIISMFMIGIRWAEIPSANKVSIGIERRYNDKQVGPSLLWLALFAGVVFSASPVFFSERINSAKNMYPIKLRLHADGGQGWALIDNSEVSWRPAYKNPAAEISGVYEKSENKVGLYIGFYRNQYFDRKLISSENVLVSSQDSKWNMVYQGVIDAEVSKGRMAVKTATLRHVNNVAGAGDTQMEVWRYYWINGYVTDSDYLAKVYTGISKILGRGDDAAVVVLHAMRGPGVDSRSVLAGFLQDNYSKIDELLHAAHAGSVTAVNTIEKM